MIKNYLFYCLVCAFLLQAICMAILFYRLCRKFITLHYWHTAWQNTINLENIVREIISKACIIAIIDGRGSKLSDEDKENKTIENASSIAADVLLQHNIEPKNYNLDALVKVEIFRIGKRI